MQLHYPFTVNAGDKMGDKCTKTTLASHSDAWLIAANGHLLELITTQKCSQQWGPFVHVSDNLLSIQTPKPNKPPKKVQALGLKTTKIIIIPYSLSSKSRMKMLEIKKINNHTFVWAPQGSNTLMQPKHSTITILTGTCCTSSLASGTNCKYKECQVEFALPGVDLQI